MIGPSIDDLERRAAAGLERSLERRADGEHDRRARRLETAAAILVGVLLAVAILVAAGGPV